MRYRVYRQRGVPQIGRWQFICETEGEEPFDWDRIIRALTNETLAVQSDRQIWWKVEKA